MREPIKIIDPTTKKQLEVSHDELWKLRFSAAGSICSQYRKGRLKAESDVAFAQCMQMYVIGFPGFTDVAQHVIDDAKFPVEEFVNKMRLKRGAFPAIFESAV